MITTGLVPHCIVCTTAGPRYFTEVSGREYWRCETCQATFLHPSQFPEPGREEAEYRLHENDPTDAGYRKYLDRLLTPLLERLSPGSRGLDYGCGPGPALAMMLRELGHEVATYDPIFAPDLAPLGRRYDFITCTEVVEHFHDPAQEFAKLDAMLERGSWLAIMTTFQTEDSAFAGWHYRRDPTHVVFYRATTFATIARRHGWRCEIPCANVAFMQKQ